MNAPLALDWLTQNQLALAEAIERLRQRIATFTSSGAPSPSPEDEPPFPALDHLAQRFCLGAFERQLLLMVCGNELSAAFSQTLAQSQAGHGEATFSLALAALEEAHWSALAPVSPLRRWQLITLEGEGALALRSLRVDERILHHLAGLNTMDGRLLDRVRVLPAAGSSLAPSHAQLARRIARGWAGEPAPLVLHGGDGADRLAVFAAIAQELGLTPCCVDAANLGADASERHAFFALWNREAALGQGALCIAGEKQDLTPLEGNLSTCPGLLMLSCDTAPKLSQGTARVYELPFPTQADQVRLWRDRLGPLAEELAAEIDRATRTFQLGTRQIAAVCARMNEQTEAREDAATTLWQAARAIARLDLGELAQRISSPSTWDDLVLPAAEQASLRLIATHVRQQVRVLQDWGFAGRSARGMGLSALFAGPSGTGKTLAAEVLANELKLDLYRIDLAGMVSKYIGETEKNLKRVFDAAQASGAILLFDEADALFGKRSEVKDSHDRHANIEVGYLLQRMESYRGLAILTSNLHHSLDKAFLRRMRFIINFPYPGVAERTAIWRRVFPEHTPTHGLNFERLAQLNLAGGSIQNIALSAAFLAAEAGEDVEMKHLFQAAQAECRKIEHPLTDVEIRGWT
ncbi:MAG: ATP-binding protein [Arenimonas sp.]